MARKDPYSAIVTYVRNMCSWTLMALAGVALVLFGTFLPGWPAAVAVGLGGAFVAWGIVSVILEQRPNIDEGEN